MKFFERQTHQMIRLVINYPKSFLLATIILTTLLAIGIKNLSISNDFRVYLSKDNPQLLAFEAFESNYVKSDSATFVISAKNGDDLFSVVGLSLISQLTETAWLLDSAYRVSSLSNYIYSQAMDDEILSDYLYRDPEQLSQQDIQQIRQRALSEPRLIQSLLTADGKLTVIVINLRLDSTHPNASIEITEKMEQIRDKFRLKYPEFQIDNGGSTAFNTTLARAVAHDLTYLMPLSYLIIFSGLMFFLRSFWATASIFILITSCLISTFGFFGWIWPVLTPIAGFAPSILLSIMVADSVHILVSYFREMEQGRSVKQSIETSLKLNLMPILVTSITTMIGFLSLNFSSSPPYRDLGNMVAFGVLIALIYSLFFLPSLMALLPIKSRTKSSSTFNLEGLATFIIAHRKACTFGMLSIVLLLTFFISNNKLSDNWFNYFDESFPIVKLVKKIDGYLTGVNSLEYSLAAKSDKGVFDPEYLHQLDQFENWFLQQDKIVKVSSLSRLMKELNQTMHGDDKAWYRVPDSSDLAAQYLLFYELGLPQGLGLDNLLMMDKSASRFSVSMTDAGSEELLALDKQALHWLAENAPAIKASPATGLGIVFAHIAQRNISSLLFGTLIALFGISVVLMLVLKSFKYGVISLVPNIIPAVMAYGFWGLTYGYIDISLSIVACSTLGIVVDDTVHFLHKYIYARKSGKNTHEAIKEAFSRVGIALITTSMVLAAGFVILAVSHMNTSATIGILMAITLVFALIVDFFLLPPLLLYFDRDKNKPLQRGAQ